MARILENASEWELWGMRGESGEGAYGGGSGINERGGDLEDTMFMLATMIKTSSSTCRFTKKILLSRCFP